VAYTDPTPGHLAQLDQATRRLATYLVIAARRAGVPLIITSSKRSRTEQLRYVLSGRSRTLNSRHLYGRAFDVDIVGWSRSAVPAEFWRSLGTYAERIGLKWPLPDWDPGHFET
jgi:hypothetical protein